MQLTEVSDTRIALLVDAKPNLQAEIWKRGFDTVLEVSYSPILVPDSEYWQAVMMELDNTCHFLCAVGEQLGAREFFRGKTYTRKYVLFNNCPYPDVEHECPYGRGTPPGGPIPCPR